MNFYRRPRFPNPQAGFIYLIILAIPLLPIAFFINLFTNDISYSEHYRRAKIARSEYQKQIQKDLLISNVSYSEDRVNYTLTNKSNTIFTGAEVRICWGDGTSVNKYFCNRHKVHSQMKNLSPNQSQEFSKFLSTGAAAWVPVTNVKISINDISYKDDCRKKTNWDSDLKCQYIHGVRYLTSPSIKDF